jgi:hypothetical protein
VSVFDLKTGKNITSSATSTADNAFEPYVSSVALASDGSVAWTDSYGTSTKVGDKYEFGSMNELRTRRATGEKTSTLIANGDSDATFLMRWSADGSHLNWTSSPKTFDFTPRDVGKSKPRRSGRCLGRKGDKLIGRGYGYVYLTRPLTAPGWDHGRTLIACSLKYKRRTILARSGTSGGITYGFDEPNVNEHFAAVATRISEPSKNDVVTVLVYDLGRGGRICGATAGEAMAKVKVPRIALDGGGTAAWIATGETGASGGATSSNSILQICDDQPPRTLWSGAELDPEILTLDDFKKQISVAIQPNVFPPAAPAK